MSRFFPADPPLRARGVVCRHSPEIDGFVVEYLCLSEQLELSGADEWFWSPEMRASYVFEDYRDARAAADLRTYRDLRGAERKPWALVAGREFLVLTGRLLEGEEPEVSRETVPPVDEVPERLPGARQGLRGGAKAWMRRSVDGFAELERRGLA